MAECTISYAHDLGAAWATAALLIKNFATSSTWTLTGQRIGQPLLPCRPARPAYSTGPGPLRRSATFDTSSGNC